MTAQPQSNGEDGTRADRAARGSATKRISITLLPLVAKSDVPDPRNSRQKSSVRDSVREDSPTELSEHLAEESNAGLEALFGATRKQLRSYYDDMESHAAKPALRSLTEIFGLADLANTSGVLTQLVEAAEEDSGVGDAISFDNFYACATAMKVGALFSLYGEGGGRLSVTDYNPRRYEHTPNVHAADRQQWLQQPTPSWASGRWVHLQSEDVADGSTQSLRLLGMQLGLHPLALEDATDLGMQR